MSRTPIDPTLMHTAESIAKAQDLRDRLFALVPRNVCEEVVREDIAASPVPIPNGLKDLVEAAKRQVKQMYENLPPEELPEEDDRITDKHIEELFRPIELSPEEQATAIAEAIADGAYRIADSLVASLCNTLSFVRSLCGHNDAIRLDDQLLPLGCDSLLGETGLPGWFGYYISQLQNQLEEGGIKKVVDAFVARVREEIDKTPDGLEVEEGVFVRKDADGYYVTPRA